MLLCLDVGNTHICGGLFDNETLCFQFRYTTQVRTVDEIGLFLKQVMRENNYDPTIIRQIAICSVVPLLDLALQAACEKYFALQPWWLNADTVPYLNIHYTNPREVGADRLANAVAAIAKFPRQALIIMDCGTATTFCAIDVNGNYLGGAISPGIRLSMESLSRNTAKLPAVDVCIATKVVGKNTIESIQSGVFFGALGACREVIARIKQEIFTTQDVLVLATGGFSSFFAKYNLYDQHLPDLALHGLRIAYNRSVV
jgi:type III pantothenate kinase